MIHVLVVDDEPQLLRALVLNLSGRGYLVSSASTGRAAMEELLDRRPDLMILDLGLPDVDGLEVIRQARERRPQLPIVVLSARTDSRDKVNALDLGAADYVTKPFDVNELVARLRAAGRRVNVVEPDEPVVMGLVSVDLTSRIVRRLEGAAADDAGSDGTGAATAVHLTPTEWRMLEVLLRRPGGLTSSTELLTAMRGSAEHTERSYLRIYMQQLRRKLEADPSRPRFLITEPGLGYRFVP